ncbi:MAG: hypothetical protein KGZ45_00715 [Clostridium sp.]|nr:hypothetical protein [Clostridium sp.]
MEYNKLYEKYRRLLEENQRLRVENKQCPVSSRKSAQRQTVRVHSRTEMFT